MKAHWLSSSVLSTALCLVLALPATAARLQSWQFNARENRLEFTTDGDVQPRAQLVTNPTRIVIDLPGVITSGPTRSRSVGGAIREVRIGRFDAQTTRIVIELNPGYTVDPEQVRVRGTSPTQWTVQLPNPQRLEQSTAESPAEAPQPAESTPSDLPDSPPPAPRLPLPQRDLPPPVRARPVRRAPLARLLAIRTTGDGLFLRTEGGSPQAEWTREGDRLILTLRNTTLSPAIPQRPITIARHGVRQVEAELMPGSPPTVRLTFVQNGDSGEWQARAADNGITLLPPPDAVTQSPDRTSPGGESSSSVATIEGIEFSAATGQLIVRGDRRLTYTSGWDRATAAFRITLPNARLSERLTSANLPDNSPLLSVRLRQEELTVVVVLIQPRAGVRVGRLSQPDRRQVALQFHSTATTGNRPVPWTPSAQLPDVPLPDNINRPVTIVLDPGHGGRDPGAIGIGGLREVDIVNSVTPEVARLLEEQGLQVVLTRPDNRSLGLEARTQTARRAGASIFVSIHANAISLSRPDVNGVETFYYSSNGQRLADLIRRSLLEATGMSDRGTKRARFFVLRNVPMPAALVELGFVTGARDAPMLANETFRRQLARAVARGILQYVAETTRSTSQN